MAYQEGTYTCKNTGTGLEDTVYKISSVRLAGIENADLPYVEMSWTYREKAGDLTSKVIKNKISGLATRTTSSNGSEYLQVGGLSVEFKGNQFLNCNNK